MADEGEGLDVFVTITAMQGARKALTVPTQTTATQLRKQVSEVTKIPLSGLRLIYRGKMIKDDDANQVISEFKLEKDCVIHCMGKPDADAQGAAAASATASTTAATATAPTTTAAAATATAAPAVDPLQAAINTLKQSNPPATFLTAVTTLEKILDKIISNPMEEKYRKLKKGNAAFQKRLGGLAGGDAAMRAAGFVVEPVDGVESYIMTPTPEAWPRLTAAKAMMEQAAKDAKAAPVATPGMMPNLAGGFGMPPAGGFANTDMSNPQVQSAMANMMSNPEALQSMLQNPMVQQMIQNDPNISPMARQSMQQIASNPAMLSQLSQMMRDPNTRAQMMNALGGGGMPGLGGMPGFPPANGFPQPGAPQQQQQQQQPGSGGTAGGGNANSGNDQDQTEEEMIAEAIRRSMNER